MPFDAGGNFSRNYNFEQDRINGIKIMSARVDGEFDNYAAGLNQTFLRTGAVPMSGNLRMGGYQLSGLADGSLASPAWQFSSEASTGMFRSAPGELAMSGAGVNIGRFNATGAYLPGLLNVTGGATVGGTLGVTGATTLSSTLAVSSNTTIGGTLGVTSGLTVGGTLLLANSGFMFSNDGAQDTGVLWVSDGVMGLRSNGVTIGRVSPTGLAVTGGISATGASTFSSSLGVTGNTTIGGTLGVTGVTTTGTLNSGNHAITGTLSTTSNATIGGTLGVTGAVTLSSTLGVTNNASVGGTLGVTGATTLNSILNVTGVTTLSNNASVGGTLAVTGGATLQSTLVVVGQLTGQGKIQSTHPTFASFETYTSAGPVNLKYWRTSSTNGGIYIIETINDAYSVGTERFRIDGNTGFAGFNGSSPVAAVDINGDLTSVANSFLGSNLYFNGGWKYRGTGFGGVVKLGDAAGGIAFLAAPNNAGGAGVAATPVETMRMLSSGAVGIGTASPAAKLHVNLGAGFSWGGNWDTKSATFGGGTNTAGAFGISYSDSLGVEMGAIIPGVAWKPFKVYSNDITLCTAGGSARLTINNNGDVLMGTTSTAGLGVGSSVNPGTAIEQAGTVSTQRNDQANYYAGKATGYSNNAFHAFYVNGSLVGSITTSGFNTAYNTTSDRYLKYNIEDADDAGGIIDAMQIRKFNWKNGGAFQPYGVIAQELFNVYHNAVTVPSNPSDPWSVDYQGLVPVLVKELQSLRKRLSDAGL